MKLLYFKIVTSNWKSNDVTVTSNYNVRVILKKGKSNSNVIFSM